MGSLLVEGPEVQNKTRWFSVNIFFERGGSASAKIKFSLEFLKDLFSFPAKKAEKVSMIRHPNTQKERVTCIFVCLEGFQLVRRHITNTQTPHLDVV